MGLQEPPSGDAGGNGEDLKSVPEEQDSGVRTSTLTTDSILSALRNQRTEKDNQLRRSAEQELRNEITSLIRTLEKTAIVASKPVLDAKVRIEQKTEVVLRTTPTNEKTSFGLVSSARERTDIEDTGNLSQRQTLIAVGTTFNRVPATAAALAPNRKREEAEITRAMSKLQRRCNHIFALSTGECQFCKKKRSAHV